MDLAWRWIIGGVVSGLIGIAMKMSWPYLSRELSYRVGNILLRQDEIHPAAYWATLKTGEEAPYKFPYSWLYGFWKWLNLAL